MAWLLEQEGVLIPRCLQSPDNSDRPRGVAMSIIVLFSTWAPICRSVADHRRWRRFPVGVDHPWWRRHHESSYFALTGQSSCWSTVTLPVLWRTVYCTLRVLTTISFAVLISTFIGSLLQKHPPVESHSMVALVTHVALRFLLWIFMRAEKQARKRMQRSKANVTRAAQFKGFHNSRV